jgi:hypothetical protein
MLGGGIPPLTISSVSIFNKDPENIIKRKQIAVDVSLNIVDSTPLMILPNDRPFILKHRDILYLFRPFKSGEADKTPEWNVLPNTASDHANFIVEQINEILLGKTALIEKYVSQCHFDGDTIAKIEDEITKFKGDFKEDLTPIGLTNFKVIELPDKIDFILKMIDNDSIFLVNFTE